MPLVNVQTLRIGELEPDFYFTDEEIEYISLDIPIDGIGVLAVHTNQFLTKELAKKLVKQILRQCIEKKKEYTALKNIWFSE